MTVAPLTFFDHFDRDNWPGWTFELRPPGDLPAAALPPTVGLTGGLGVADSYTWERAPGSPVFRPFGDALPAERPLLQLGGTWAYASLAEALDHAAEVEQAVVGGAQVFWRGQHLATLHPTAPGSCVTSAGRTFTETTYALVLNTTERITRARLAEVQR